MLEGKTVIVTGAAKGIGKAIAIAFAKEGCNIVLNYHSSVSDETVKEIEEQGVKCMLSRREAEWQIIVPLQVWVMDFQLQ